MMTYKRTIVTVLAISLILILISISKGNQVIAGYAKHDSHQSESIIKFYQEKSKYLYVGPEKCASTCHNNKDSGFQLDLWKGSKHAAAFLELSSKKAFRFAKNAKIKSDPWISPVCFKVS